jgi:CRISPR-associated protein Csb2
MVAAAAASWNERRGVLQAASALRWLEALPAPHIVACGRSAIDSTGYRLYVPDNVGDEVGRAWSKGNNASLAEYRADKTVRTTRLIDPCAVSYLWPLGGRHREWGEHRSVILRAAGAITRVGWGVDLVAAEAVELSAAQADGLEGHRYRPVEDGLGSMLRVPQQGSFDDLERRHSAFLNRLRGGTFVPVAPLSVYRLVHYSAETEPPRLPFAVFALRKPDDSGFRAFDAVRRALHVAGMLRHAASQPDLTRAIGWGDDEVRRIILGHGEAAGTAHQPVAGGRYAFLPLPSIEWRGDRRRRAAGAVRRVLVMALGAVDREVFRRFGRQFEGRELLDEKTGSAVAIVSRQATHDPAIAPYLQTASSWATVTPLVLPGHDDPRKLRRRLREPNGPPLEAAAKNDLVLRLEKRVDGLLRKAIRQAGYSEEMATHAELEWGPQGFWPGTDSASRYTVPEQHRRYRRLHLKITWRSPGGQPIQMPGPICLGGGRFSGLGLMAAL